jgi:hypothetical protein
MGKLGIIEFFKEKEPSLQKIKCFLVAKEKMKYIAFVIDKLG